MRAQMLQGYAHPVNGCLNAGDVLTDRDDAPGKKVDRELIAELVECGAAVGVDDEGAPIRPKAETAKRKKSGETATQES